MSAAVVLLHALCCARALLPSHIDINSGKNPWCGSAARGDEARCLAMKVPHGGARLSTLLGGASKALKRKVPVATVIAAAIAGGAIGYSSASVVQKLKIYRTAEAVPAELIERHAYLKGRVISVTDGDTMRIRHMPFGRDGRWSKRKVSDDTIVIRLAAVDTPEIGKMGRPGQPFAEEAKTATERLVKGKVVRVKMLRRDQYGRIVGMMYAPSRWPLGRKVNVSMDLLQQGLAVVYRQAGAEYDGQKDAFDKMEEKMRGASKPKGLWADKNFVPPSQFKADKR